MHYFQLLTVSFCTVCGYCIRQPSCESSEEKADLKGVCHIIETELRGCSSVGKVNSTSNLLHIKKTDHSQIRITESALARVKDGQHIY